MSCPTDCSVEQRKDTKVFYKQHSNCGVSHLNIGEAVTWFPVYSDALNVGNGTSQLMQVSDFRAFRYEGMLQLAVRLYSLAPICQSTT